MAAAGGTIRGVAEWRIDDLARVAGTTVRNVRVYQDRGLLPAPRREGRVGWYDEHHLSRLRLIARLLERGYTFAHIAELQQAWESGRDLAQVLGLEDALTRPWSEEEPERFGLSELRAMFGKGFTPGVVERVISLGLLRREGTRLVARSPQLLRAGAALAGLGMPLPAVLDVAEGLQRDMDAIAARFVTAFLDNVVGPLGPDGLPRPEDVAGAVEAVEQLRPLAQTAVDAVLAQAMERQVSAVMGEAVTTALRGRRDIAG